MPKTWNKSDLVQAIAEKAGLEKKQAAACLDAFIDVITQALKHRDKIQLTGFGSFETRERKERKARIIQTGKEIVVPASVAPAFKPGKALKDAIQ